MLRILRVHAPLLLGTLCLLMLGSSQAQESSSAQYAKWLEERSMLAQGSKHAQQFSGSSRQWQHPYGKPQPRAAVQRASVWLLDYPGSVIPKPGKSVIATWGDEELWRLLEEIGIQLLHTAPINRAGGIRGREYTPSIDGWFDPIALEIDPQLGSEEEYRAMVRTAGKHGGLIAGDLVPLHTGLGADFRLATMGYKDYPSVYTMVEIRKEDWPLLPVIKDSWDCQHVPKTVAEELTRKKYLPGLINSNDAAPEAKTWSGWSATGEVVGADGKTRRWVYLHYFKPGQPALNWLDPALGGPRLVFGDLSRTVGDLGARVVRLDAVPFLGIESDPGKTLTVHFKHPLSITGTNQIAFLTRKLGGWSFHELNIPLEELKLFTANGPDLSYDFFTRAQCLHALLTGDARPLRLAFRWLQEAKVGPQTLVHDLQNHDEITYQLVELDHRKDELLDLGGEKLTGKQLKDQMLQQMRERAAGAAAPHNKLYRSEQDGVATTFAAFVAASLSIRDPYQATPEQIAEIRRGHLLLAWVNALQPGVFSLSSWDLVGALPIPAGAVEERMKDGDYRWVNRGGVDLLGANPEAMNSASGIARAKVLYGSLPEQLKDPQSFVSKVKELLAVRRQHRIAEAELVDVAAVKHKGACVLILRLRQEGSFAITALNFGREAITEEVTLAGIPGLTPAKLVATDPFNAKAGAKPIESGRITLELDGHQGKVVILAPAEKNG